MKILLILGIIGLVFSIKNILLLIRCKNAPTETYSKDIPEYMKQEINNRNKARILPIDY